MHTGNTLMLDLVKTIAMRFAEAGGGADALQQACARLSPPGTVRPNLATVLPVNRATLAFVLMERMQRPERQAA